MDRSPPSYPGASLTTSWLRSSRSVRVSRISKQSARSGVKQFVAFLHINPLFADYLWCRRGCLGELLDGVRGAARPSFAAAQSRSSLGAAAVARVGEQAAHREAHAARRLEAARERHAHAGPADPGARSPPGRPRGRTPPPARRSPAPAPPCRGRRGRRPRRTAASSARRTPSPRAARSAAPAIGVGRRAPVRAWRARAPARRPAPRAPRARSRCSGSCEVLGATSTSGASPGGSSTSPNGCSHSSGPVTAHPGPRRARGYSSCGNVATIASSREMPPCVSVSGGSPTRSRAPFSSTPARSSPVMTSGRAPRPEARARARVRGYDARRSSRSGSPARPWACTCGIERRPAARPPPARRATRPR